MAPVTKICHVFLVLSIVLSAQAIIEKSSSSIYEVLKSNGLPMGLLPKGVKNFSLDKSGRLEVYLEQPCNAKFENEFHYDMNVSGIISYGQIDELSGISAQDLFLWLPVKEIRVDIPSSGLIYFNVSVVSKQFPVSSFETPRECTAVKSTDRIPFEKHIKGIIRKFKFQLNEEELNTAAV